MKKVLVTVSIIVTGILFYFNQPDRTPYDETKLSLPSCALLKPTITTRVSYFVDASLREVFKENIVTKQVALSNKILANSCLPLRREIALFDYVDFELSGEEYFEEVHAQGVTKIGKDVIKRLREDPFDFYVFVLPNRHLVFGDGSMGATYWELSDSYILLADDADLDTLEHEFGHLMWANHSETKFFALLQGELERSTPREFRHLVKRYARAYKCANAGTVMSYEDVRLPVYSSPMITYRSERCGNEINADNRRRVLEYINDLRVHLEQNK